MANNIDGPEITLKASGDLSSSQFCIVTLDTDGKVKVADDADDPVEALIGVLQNKPDAADEPAVVRVGGIAKVMGGASLNEGVWVTCDGTGYAVASVANDNNVGITIDALASGEIGRILLAQTGGHVVPT
tara:strand:- start:1264 stop:1653 length:390 start_codon:yes stop_codon:yes gene_type:complete